MKMLDPVVRVVVLAQGTGSRWLREELDVLQMKIPLTDGCLDEFVRDADAAVARSASSERRPYVESLRQQLGVRAKFIQQWTGSDDKILLDDAESLQSLVRIARKYALPRRWKLSEPVVVEYRRMRPSYWTWTDDVDSGAVAQS
jgi:hypothetical protein